jgi:hypothetical protein
MIGYVTFFAHDPEQAKNNILQSGTWIIPILIWSLAACIFCNCLYLWSRNIKLKAGFGHPGSQVWPGFRDVHLSRKAKIWSG